MKILSSLVAAALAMLPGGTMAKDSAVTESELRGFQGRLQRVQPGYEKWHKEFVADLEKAEDALEVDQIRTRSRAYQVGYLRFLLILEEDFRLLLSPVDAVHGEEGAAGFSTQERRRVASLRQEIRDAERERIRSELKEGREMRSDEKVEKAISRDEQSLDAVYDRNASKLKRDIARAERDLAKEQVSAQRDDKVIAELEKNLEEWRATLGTLHEFTYGFAPGPGFRTEPDASDTSEAGKFLATLAAEREKVIKSIRGDEEEGGEGEKKGGVVGGSFLYSSNLGVVLDVSGSMAPHIEKLKEEIAATFEVPRYREVGGCAIYGGATMPPPVQGAGVVGTDTMIVIEELCVVWGVDTVYWFCDLRDGFDYQGLRRLRSLLMRSGAAFHVKSMAMRPDRELKPLIDDFQD